MTVFPILRRLALDACLWLCAPLVFLWIYTSRYAVADSAVWPHLQLVLLAFAALSGLRLLLAGWFADAARLRLASCALLATLWYAMLLYYGAVLLGLRSWGRVISAELVASYIGQADKLAATLEISIGLIIFALAAVWLLLLALSWLYLKKFDWSRMLAQQLPARWRALGLPLLFALIGARVFLFWTNADASQSEPLSMTLFAADAAIQLQGNTIDRVQAALLDRADAAARAAYQVNPQAQRRNVIVIVVDALRPDHLGLYGYARNTTPYLNRQATQALRAPTVRAACAESACGAFSLLTSKYVHQFSEHPFTLQQVLQRYGYRIHMILSSDHTHFYGIRKIYGDVDSYFDGASLPGRYGNDDKLVLDKAAALPAWDGAPTMFQFHLMSNHILGTHHQKPQFTPAANYAFGRKQDASTTSNASAINYYDNGVLESDAAIGQLLTLLQAKGYLQNSTVVITADHGELLGEHGLYTHANGVWEEVLQIPFIVLPYGYQSHAFDGINHSRRAASQIDIAPTLLAELDMPPPASWSGKPLQQQPQADYTYFQEGAEMGLIDQREPENVWKYWVNLKSGAEHAFNLSRDPHEQRDLIHAVDAARLQTWRAQPPLRAALAGTQ